MESKKPDALEQDLEVTATGKSKRKGRRDSCHKKLRKQKSSLAAWQSQTLTTDYHEQSSKNREFTNEKCYINEIY